MAEPNTGISGLITACESVFTAVTGQSSANVEKVTSGLSAVADGLLPTVESRVRFDLGQVIAGVTAILTGTALVLAGMKRRGATSPTVTNQGGTPGASVSG